MEWLLVIAVLALVALEVAGLMVLAFSTIKETEDELHNARSPF